MKLGPLLLVVLGLAVGWCGAIAFHVVKTEAVSATASGDLQCPMHPWIKSTHSGTCTVCGMALVPVASGHASSESAGQVMLPPASVSVTGVQTATVKRMPLVRTLRFAGRFEEDASAHAIISAPVEGRIDGLGLVHGNGIVTQRQPLATVFSRTLLAAAKEYKDALNHDEAATAAARKKLEHYGLVWEQIQSIPLRQDNDIYFGLLSPRSGSVVKSYCSEGQYVREGDRLFEITDLSKLWFMFSVFEQDLPLFKTGQTVDIETSAVPPEKVKAQITFIEKNLDEATHSFHVRVDVANPKGLLHLNGDGICTVNLEAMEVLAVPRTAVLWPGDEPRVFVETQAGSYERHRVKLGHVGDRDWEVLDGLKEGERVVTQAAILMDGQAQLKVAQ